MAPVDSPREAMMKENSPICPRLMPAWTEVRTPYPARNAPTETPVTLPATTRHRNTTVGSQYRSTRAGSIIMPTETKNTAAKASHNGFTIFSIGRASPDSATSAPAMKAPSATE